MREAGMAGTGGLYADLDVNAGHALGIIGLMSMEVNARRAAREDKRVRVVDAVTTLAARLRQARAGEAAALRRAEVAERRAADLAVEIAAGARALAAAQARIALREAALVRAV